jgi:hypothetical protein
LQNFRQVIIKWETASRIRCAPDCIDADWNRKCPRNSTD